MWQTLTFAVHFAFILATIHQKIPKDMLCLEEPERVRRHAAILYVLGNLQQELAEILI